MTMSFTAQPSVRKAERIILKTPQSTRRGIRLAYFRLGNDLVKESRRLIRQGPKTGRLYRIHRRRHRASAPGEAPANLTGLLSRSIAYQQRGGNQMRFGARAAYAPFLELGAGSLQKRPFLITSINKNERNAETYFEQEIKTAIKRGK